MEEWKSDDRERGEGDGFEGNFHNDHGEESEEEEDEDEGELTGRSRKSIRPMLWMVLSVTATLAGRQILRGGFREFFPGEEGVVMLKHVLTDVWVPSVS
jgi:hypothetical protein